MSTTSALFHADEQIRQYDHEGTFEKRELTSEVSQDDPYDSCHPVRKHLRPVGQPASLHGIEFAHGSDRTK
jgi:hypothetical protein